MAIKKCILHPDREAYNIVSIRLKKQTFKIPLCEECNESYCFSIRKDIRDICSKRVENSALKNQIPLPFKVDDKHLNVN